MGIPFGRFTLLRFFFLLPLFSLLSATYNSSHCPFVVFTIYLFRQHLQSILIATSVAIHLSYTILVFVSGVLEVRLYSLVFDFFIFIAYLVVIGDYFEFVVFWGAI